MPPKTGVPVHYVIRLNFFFLVENRQLLAGCLCLHLAFGKGEYFECLLEPSQLFLMKMGLLNEHGHTLSACLPTQSCSHLQPRAAGLPGTTLL